METQLKEIIRSVIREQFIAEMSQNDVNFKAIMKFYDRGTSNAKKAISLFLFRKPNARRNDIVDELMEMNYNDIQDIMKHFKLKLEYVDSKLNGCLSALPKPASARIPLLLNNVFILTASV